jgi:hypothetical protein
MNDTLARLRQCHAIEHATVAVLLERRRGRRMRVAGLSHPGGFVLACSASPGEVLSAAREAASRLAAGESHLAISEHCGTTIAVGALLTASAVRLALLRRGPFSRAVIWAAGALVASPAAGAALQKRFTTSAAVGDRSVSGIQEIVATPFGPLVHVGVA